MGKTLDEIEQRAFQRGYEKGKADMLEIANSLLQAAHEEFRITVDASAKRDTQSVSPDPSASPQPVLG